MSRWECKTEMMLWHFPVGYDRITVITRHWFLWTAKLYRLAVMSGIGYNPIGMPLSCEITRLERAA